MILDTKDIKDGGVSWLWPTQLFYTDDFDIESFISQQKTDDLVGMKMKKLKKMIHPKLDKFFQGKVFDSRREFEIIDIQIRSLVAGKGVNYRSGFSEYECILAITKVNRAEHERSGMLMLFDPRDGCSNVSLKGQPLGRSISLELQSGMIVLYPGFLKYAITPVNNSFHYLHMNINFK